MTQGLATRDGAIDFGVSTRRVGLCWEATRAPRRTRIPQAWAERSAQAGLLRDRQECEKSQGVWGTASLKSFPHQIETETTTGGKSELALSANRRFTLNQYITILGVRCTCTRVTQSRKGCSLTRSLQVTPLSRASLPVAAWFSWLWEGAPELFR